MARIAWVIALSSRSMGEAPLPPPSPLASRIVCQRSRVPVIAARPAAEVARLWRASTWATAVRGSLCRLPQWMPSQWATEASSSSVSAVRAAARSSLSAVATSPRIVETVPSTSWARCSGTRWSAMRASLRARLNSRSPSAHAAVCASSWGAIVAPASTSMTTARKNAERSSTPGLVRRIVAAWACAARQRSAGALRCATAAWAGSVNRSWRESASATVTRPDCSRASTMDASKALAGSGWPAARISRRSRCVGGTAASCSATVALTRGPGSIDPVSSCAAPFQTRTPEAVEASSISRRSRGLPCACATTVRRVRGESAPPR